MALSSISQAIYNLATSFVHAYGYIAVLVLMTLESASLPVPSEVVLPLAGLLAHRGILNVYVAFAAAFAGSMIGSAVDYSIGYVIGKEVVYKHLQLFHIKKHTLDAFDSWFERNAVPAVLFSRLIPVARTFMSFPAGFAKMEPKHFFFYTAVGCIAWDAALIAFGYYLLSASSAVIELTAIGAFAVVLYLVYRYAIRKMTRKHKG